MINCWDFSHIVFFNGDAVQEGLAWPLQATFSLDNVHLKNGNNSCLYSLRLLNFNIFWGQLTESMAFKLYLHGNGIICNCFFNGNFSSIGLISNSSLMVIFLSWGLLYISPKFCCFLVHFRRVSFRFFSRDKAPDVSNIPILFHWWHHLLWTWWDTVSQIRDQCGRLQHSSSQIF